jgi:hypothetical protein
MDKNSEQVSSGFVSKVSGALEKDEGVGSSVFCELRREPGLLGTLPLVDAPHVVHKDLESWGLDLGIWPDA